MARLAPEDRRRELVGIGLELLLTRPLTEISVDEVAARAGISRSLLFHYYPTKRDYLAAVVRAASRRFLLAAEAGGAGVLAASDEVPSPEEGRARVVATLDSLLTWIGRRREPYVALLRAATNDEVMGEAYRAAQDELGRRVLRALGRSEPTPLEELCLHGWLSLVQDVALRWTRDPAGISRDALREHLERSLGAVLAPAGIRPGTP